MIIRAISIEMLSMVVFAFGMLFWIGKDRLKFPMWVVYGFMLLGIVNLSAFITLMMWYSETHP